MPQADPRAAHIIELVGHFEDSVAAAENALRTRDWVTVETALRDQRRLTHALANALDETAEIRPPAFTAEVQRRIDAIVERRGRQLERLIAFNASVKERLSLLARSRSARRSFDAGSKEPQLLDRSQ